MMATDSMLIKILIVEDDPQIAEIQRRFLQRIGNVELCGIAHTLQDARDLADVFKPNLILLDVHLPDGNGLDLLRQWRAANQDFDIILITAAKEVETLKSALHAGVFEYILKPLVFERLVEAIERYKQHLIKLDQMSTIAQDQLDQFIPTSSESEFEKNRHNTRLPKGIDGITLDKVRTILNTHKALNAEEVGSEIGASRTTARRYLEFLISSNELCAEVSYGQVGRPERRYIKV